MDLRVQPAAKSKSLGRLPKGSIVTQKGERKDKFYRIEVELEDGVVEGWVPEDALTEASKGNAKEEKPDPEAAREGPEEPAERLRPSGRLRIPKDEGLLLRREQSFLYGLQVMPEYDILATDIDTSTYTGIGYTVGAFVGLYLAPNLTVNLEGNYAVVSGTGDGNGVFLQFGFFEVNAQIHYLIERFEIAGGIQYSVGISLNDVPAELQLGSAFDMSSLYGVGSVGFRQPLNEFLTLTIRARYATAFLRAPVAIQRIGLSLGLEFGG